MAKKISNISSGVYFRETDLTFLQSAVGTFSGGAIVLCEKGPAFETMTSSSMSERTVRMGGLNPNYKSSYFANEFLKQASNYKEVRMLGKEGYNEKPNYLTPGDVTTNIGGLDKCFVIAYAKEGNATATATTPVVIATESIACILKPRRGSYLPSPIVSVTVGPVTGEDDATDDKFQLTIVYENSATYPNTEVICSLRPESSQYITTVFGTSPLDNTKVLQNPAPLWVEVVFPSEPSKLTAKGEKHYYLPGADDESEAAPNDKLLLLEGNITVDLNFQYPEFTFAGEGSLGIEITEVDGVNVSVVVKALTAVTGVVPGGDIVISGLTPASSLGTDPALNGKWRVLSIANGKDYTITDANGLVPQVSGVFVNGASKTIQRSWSSTWETQIMNLGGKSESENLEFQTPTTPWFVDKFDANSVAKRLFRIWSISDGKAANTEIKIEIANIDASGNAGFGSFDLYVRAFSDTDDKSRTLYEGFPNLTMNPASTNYILRRIGDGDNFPLQSKFIFIELNEDEILPRTAIPYGVEGYTNVTNLTFPDVVWTTQYDLTKSIAKQTLGLANNSANMFKRVDAANLIYKNITGSTTKGLGFHLNPGFSTDSVISNFVLTDPNSYNISETNTTKTAGLNLTKRMRYVVSLEGGFDGWNVYSQRTWDDITSKDYEVLQQAIDVFADGEDLTSDFSVLVTPDLNFQKYPSSCQAVLEMVETRGDALYLFDFDYGYSRGEKPEIISSSAAQDLSYSNMLSSYSATYYPDVQISDETNNLNVWCPPSIVALATVARTAMLENVWQPPAGSLRTVTDSLVRVRKRMKVEDREILKKVNINPITIFPGSGIEITESRTTQETFSALSFIHNRLLLGYAKKALNQILRPLLHQLKSENLKSDFKNTITPVFERIKKLNGLETFEVSVDGSDEDRTTLNGVITIEPLYPVERIVIDFVLSNGSLEFNQ